jgi:dephospho-CoA kinase
MPSPPLCTRPQVLALTGSIGSGKSTFARAFAQLGVPCIDADVVARTIHQDPDHRATRAIALAFPQAMTPEGRLARGSLRTVFAADPGANEELKRLLRPAVLEQVERWTLAQAAPYVIWESALSIDHGIATARVLVIDASEESRLARIALRNPDWSRAQALAVVSMQPPRTAYLAGADDVIVNDGPADAIAALVAQLHQTYLTLWSSP